MTGGRAATWNKMLDRTSNGEYICYQQQLPSAFNCERLVSYMGKEKRLVDAVFLLKRRCMMKTEELSAESGLAPREMAAIESLAHGERVSGNELSRRMEISASRGSRIIERLIRKGFLVRETDPLDRRATLLSLSAKGVERKEEIDALKDECERLLRSKIDGARLDEVRESLEILLNAL